MPNTDYLLNDISGNQITLNEIKGKNGTLIIFLAIHVQGD